jgi:hypothetical protein
MFQAGVVERVGLNWRGREEQPHQQCRQREEEQEPEDVPRHWRGFTQAAEASRKVASEPTAPVQLTATGLGMRTSTGFPLGTLTAQRAARMISLLERSGAGNAPVARRALREYRTGVMG